MQGCRTSAQDTSQKWVRVKVFNASDTLLASMSCWQMNVNVHTRMDGSLCEGEQRWLIWTTWDLIPQNLGAYKFKITSFRPGQTYKRPSYIVAFLQRASYPRVLSEVFLFSLPDSTRDLTLWAYSFTRNRVSTANTVSCLPSH